MDTHPLISVIVPVYNVERYIERCIDSIISQTYDNLDIILVDDGSTDSSLKICQQYQEKNPRIRVLHKQNGGQASARNMGLETARGDLIAFVDSDDWIEKTMYETLLHNLYKYECDISACQFGDDTNAEQSAGEVHVYSQEESIALLLQGKVFTNAVCDKLFKRSVWQGIRFPEVRVYEDNAVVYRCLMSSTKIVYSDNKLYHYCSRADSTLHKPFTIDRFVGASISQRRSEDIINRYEKLQKTAVNTFLEEAFYLLWWSNHASRREFKKERKTVAKDVLLFADKYSAVPLDEINKKKIFLLRYGLWFYDIVWDLYHKIINLRYRIGAIMHNVVGKK